VASGEAGLHTLAELQAGLIEGVDPTRKEVRSMTPFSIEIVACARAETADCCELITRESCNCSRGAGLLVRCRVPFRDGNDTRSIHRVQEVEANLDEKEGWDLLVNAIPATPE